MKCIACGSPNLNLFMELKNAPMVSQPIGQEHLGNDKTVPITVLKCECCTLVQLKRSSYTPDAYYEQYFLDRHHSSFSNTYQQRIAKHFVSSFRLKGKSVIDVGCGDGTFGALLQRNGVRVTGIDPSREACREARKKGIRVIHGAMTKRTKLNATYDAFTTTQVLEHMADPREFLASIVHALSPHAVGMVEVPSLSKTLKEKRFYDFFPDHVAYYNPTSLSRLLRSVGFRVISMQKTLGGEYLTAFVELDPEAVAMRSMGSFYRAYRHQVETFMKRLGTRKIALWGAGIRGIPLVSMSGLSDSVISYCIDSDPHKQGKYLPGSHIRVVSPDMLKKDTPDVIIITASFYAHDIVKTLKQKYHYMHKVAILFPEPRYLRYTA